MAGSKVGILALQGAVEPHKKHLLALGAQVIEVRKEQDLCCIDRLIIPGGESTTMLKLLKRNHLWNVLKEFVSTKPVWGICAGAILLASETLNPEQDCLAALPVSAERNHYGSQLESFSAVIKAPSLQIAAEVDFIRAPLLKPQSSEVAVLSSGTRGEAVLLEYKNIIISSFHTELREDPWLHRYFILNKKL